ncbi:STAS domain-containing protein [Fundidesulfovibrio agrisoli]|uniref:STAS domain-containing protein n=1 Tax=Fundidesulfovibrio agrisoli TaxID=2922717 RepID=UPI001FAE48ED|nr:STAS domain-containing protein [Fundidesulfovibrio agrisoli]
MSDEQQTPWTATADQAAGSARIEGELDFTNSLAVRDWLKDLCAQTTGELKLDLEGLRYIDSSGLAILIEIRKFLAAKQRGIRILKVSSQVSKLFSLTQIGELFGI